ncbi:MAG: hypothetical protein Q8M76_13955 [Spirochaetaceae bacterium]|nr:hypothetical protein [Spirochaetaceae bacterium]
MTDGAPHLAFIVGAAPEGKNHAPVFIVPGLDYDSFSGFQTNNLQAAAEHLARELEEAIRRAFPKGCDLIHVHNPLLRKNARLLGALGLLQGRGYALLVQEHDFAEDFRPDVYDRTWPYPDSCDYATINSRDRDNLIASGLDPRHVHLLPNPVAHQSSFSPREDGAREIARGRTLALYPVRAIRRKNVGETLLLSRFLPKGAELAITLPPTSTGDFYHYSAWKKRVTEGSWRVRFEAGMKCPLSDLFERSFCVVTTSVKEGFGYSYLDPLARGLPVIGRKIPHIVGDFSDAGVDFEGLYESIRVPSGIIDGARLRGAVAARLERYRETFGPAFGGREGEVFEPLLAALERRFESATLDFGALDEDLQFSVLERVREDGDFAKELLRLNPFLESLFERATEADEAIRLRDAVDKGYSEREHGKSLVAAYTAAIARESKGGIDKAALIARCLDPSAFFLSAS